MGEVLVFTPKRLGHGFEKNRWFAMVEGGKWVGAARAGFDGTIVAHNEALVRKPELYRPAEPGKTPPWWVRGTLCLTCTGVSFAHGNNDGQKGLGLLMLILVGIIPGIYAINPDFNSVAQLSAASGSGSMKMC